MEEKEYKFMVIEKARELFKIYGYKKTSMEDIAKACHKSKGLIYHYYESKEEIFKIIINDEFNQIYSELNKKIETNISIKEKFYHFFTISNAWLNDNTNMYSKIIPEVFDYIDIINDDLENFHNKTLEIIKKLLKEGVKNNNFKLDNIDLTSISILQMLLGFLYNPLKQILNSKINIITDIKKFIDIIYYGLEKR